MSQFIKKFNHPLTLIIIGAFFLRIINLDYNSPFVDEAIYLQLGRKVLTNTWAEVGPFMWVGGMPLFYPPLSAIAGFFGGVIGSRLLNVVLGTISVFFLYHFAKNLRLSENEGTNEFIALFSSLVFSFMGIPIYLSRLATYDMLSFTLFLGGHALLFASFNLKKTKDWKLENRLFLSALLIFLSFLGKYITLLLYPISIFWVLLQEKKGKAVRISFSLKYFVFPLISLTGAYIIWAFSDLLSFYNNQVHDIENHSLTIIQDFVRYTEPVIFLSGLGILLLIIKKNTTGFFLLFGSFFILLIHLATNNLDSVHQHVFVSLIFLLPALGFLISQTMPKKPILQAVLSAVVLLLVYKFSYTQAKSLEASWPNTEKVMSFLRKKADQSSRILSSEGDVSSLALSNIPYANFNSFWDLDYQGTEGTSAYNSGRVFQFHSS